MIAGMVMPTGLITKRLLERIQIGEKAQFVWDTKVKGFGLKITPNGARSYVYQFRLGGRLSKVQRMSIGSTGNWTPETAREEAIRLARLVDTGIDPVYDRKQRQQDRASLDFADYAKSFADVYLKAHWPGGYDLAEGILRREISPFFRGRPINEISRKDIAMLTDKLSDRPGLNRNAFAVLRKLFAWAIDRGDISISPIAGVKPPKAPLVRDRVLSDSELVVLWKVLQLVGAPFQHFISMLLLTGQRRAEVSGLKWSELDKPKAIWTLPAARSKNGKAHEIPLSKPVLVLLDSMASSFSTKTWPITGLVFSTNGLTSISGYSKAKARLDRLIAAHLGSIDDGRGLVAEFPEWRLHDLRRTVATGLQKLGVRFEVTEAILNHKIGAGSSIARVYQHHQWQAEKKEALDAWGKHLLFSAFL